jgi:hypothetical protein
MRMQWCWGSVQRIYEVGDTFYRKRNQVRTFTKSVQEKEKYESKQREVGCKVRGSIQDCGEEVNAVVYVAEIDGERKRIHAVNMKPGVRLAQREESI